MLDRFRWEYEEDQIRPHVFVTGQGFTLAKRWFLFHDAVLFDAEVQTVAEVVELGIGPGVPGYDGVALIFSCTLDRIVLKPFAPARPHPDVDDDLMKIIEGRESPLLVRYPNGRHWQHIPEDSIA